jgi:hypothetical protein
MRLSEFIPAYLELTSQAALKVQMMQPISLDAPVGRIAVFEVLGEKIRQGIRSGLISPQILHSRKIKYRSS